MAVNTKSLKTIIAVNIFILLTVAVFLTDLVIVALNQNRFLKNKSHLHQQLTYQIRPCLPLDADKTPVPTRRDSEKIQSVFDNSRVLAGMVVDPQGSLLASGGDLTKRWRRELEHSAARALRKGQYVSSFSGNTWGVFFPRRQFLIVSCPVFMGKKAVAAISTVFNLQPFYAGQRQVQGTVLIYGVVNILILTILGTFALNNSAVRPIHRLVKRAEEYQKDEQEPDFGFHLYQEKNEFRQLSNALNRMLQRISEDKERLQTSLVNLEKANEELSARQNELIKAEKLASVGRLAAGIAHEIGNPIGIVLGYLEMLNQDTLSPEEKSDYIDRCQKEINRINEVIRELLNFSRPPVSQEKEILAVHDLIRQAVEMLQVQPHMDQISFCFFLEAKPDTVPAVSDRLRQVLVNLLLNAVDAISAADNPENGYIEIRTATEATKEKNAKGRWLSISITDNGSGIDEAEVDNIFDPFYTTKEPGKGTGLGLSVCYMIVEGLGGDISVSSRDGQGTTFTVRLPAEDPRQDQEE